MTTKVMEDHIMLSPCPHNKCLSAVQMSDEKGLSLISSKHHQHSAIVAACIFLRKGSK